MAGFFKRLFGGNDEGEGANPANAEPNETYKGVEIRANPVKESGGQWRIAGTVTKEVDGQRITRQFVRADLVQDKTEAIVTCVNKAKLIIDQNGEGIWRGDLDRPV
ncbi:MAG: HlyU family transcriptional regulator [Pseudomonadota bacterium]